MLNIIMLDTQYRVTLERTDILIQDSLQKIKDFSQVRLWLNKPNAAIQ